MSSRGTAAPGRAIAGVARIKAAETSMILDIDGFLLAVGSLAINHTAPIPPRVDRDRDGAESDTAVVRFGIDRSAAIEGPRISQGPSTYASPLYSAVNDAG